MLELADLKAKSEWVRRETLLLHRRCPETRLASSLSCVEILTALFYGGVLRFDPRQPRWEGRDRFLVSKGHGSISFYPILADLGFIDMGELEAISQEHGVLKVIPDTLISGYETINGSLGHGPGVACGVALALRGRGSDRGVFALTGDGELNEGSVWEAVMFAGHHALRNLTLVVDRNGASMLGFCRDILDLSPLADKFRAFGWEAMEVDGHDLSALVGAFGRSRAPDRARPLAIMANTVKGKGVPWLETDPLSHIRILKPEQVDAVLGGES